MVQFVTLSHPIGHKKSPKSKFLVLSLWNASLVSPFISAFPCLYESFSFPHQIFCSTILFRELSRKTAEAVQRVQCCDWAVLASHWSVSPSSASDWLAAVTRPATHNTLLVTWPRLWPGVNTVTTRVSPEDTCVLECYQDVSAHVSHHYQV